MSAPAILIVEDEAIVAADLARQLEQLGYRVAGSVASGQEAIEWTRRDPPALVLIDIRLSGAMDGIEVAKVIQSERDLPVVFLTAHTDAATIERAKLVEPLGYVTKPFEMREVRTAIELGLHKHRVDRQVREQREWFRVALGSIGDGIITCDNEGRVTFLNSVAEKLTGWSLVEALGLPIQRVFRLINEKSRQPCDDLAARVLREKRTVGLASGSALVAKDGHECSIEDCAAPILDVAGQVIGALLVFRDVTEKRRAEAALLAKTEELECFNRAMIGRELRMIELKKEVDELCRRFGEPSRYGYELPPAKVAEPPPGLP